MIRRVAVILNPASGATDDPGVATQVAGLFDSAGIAARVELLRPGAVAEMVHAAARDADAVIAAGGDGTINSVASALVGSKTPLGVLPLGTLNHFAKDAGIPLDVKQAVATIAGGHIAQLDVGEVNGRTFLNNSSIGIYPDVVIEREALRKQGYRKSTALVLASWKIVRNHRGVLVRIRVGEEIQSSATPFLFVGNNEYDMDGLDLGGRKRLDGGQLFAYLAPRLRSRQLPRLFALALVGRASDRGVLQSFGTVELTVDIPGRRHVRVAVDGEVMVMRPPLQYRVRPGALQVVVPGR